MGFHSPLFMKREAGKNQKGLSNLLYVKILYETHDMFNSTVPPFPCIFKLHTHARCILLALSFFFGQYELVVETF